MNTLEPVMCPACADDRHTKCWQVMLDDTHAVACCCTCEKAQAAQRRVSRDD